MRHSFVGALALLGVLVACSGSTSPEDGNSLPLAGSDPTTSTDGDSATSAGNDSTASGTYVTCDAAWNAGDFNTTSRLFFINAAPRYEGVNLCVKSVQTRYGQPFGTGHESPIPANDTIPRTLVVTETDDSMALASAQVSFNNVDARYTVVFTQHSTNGGLLVLLDTVSAPPSGYTSFRVVNATPSVSAM